MKLLFIAFLIALAIKAHATSPVNETEVGIAVAKGNTRSETYNIKQINNYQVDQNIFRFQARYLNAFANDQESARFISLSLRYERELSQKLSAFTAESIDKDPYAGYRSRVYTDIGGKYFLEQKKESLIFLEAGYRYFTEKRMSQTQASSNYARALMSVEKNAGDSMSLRWWGEYIPNLNVSREYFVNSEVSLSFVMSSLISFRTGYLLRYNHAPLVKVATTDKLFTSALVAKF